MTTLAEQIDHALEVRRLFSSMRSPSRPLLGSEGTAINTAAHRTRPREAGLHDVAEMYQEEARCAVAASPRRTLNHSAEPSLAPRSAISATSPTSSGALELTGSSAESPDDAEDHMTMPRPAALSAPTADYKEVPMTKKDLRSRPMPRPRRRGVIVLASEVLVAAFLTAISAAAVFDPAMLRDPLADQMGTVRLVVLVCAALLLISRAVAFVARVAREPGPVRGDQSGYDPVEELERRLQALMTVQLNHLREDLYKQLGFIESGDEQLVSIREDLAAMQKDLTTELREVSRPLIGLRGR